MHSPFAVVLHLFWLNANHHALERCGNICCPDIVCNGLQDRLGSEEAGSSALHSSLLAQQHVQLVKQACSANDGWAQVRSMIHTHSTCME